MNHRPFEDWLLDEKALASAEKRQMQAHLRECRTCSALAEVNIGLDAVRAVAPAAGFVDRFQVRLAAQRRLQRRMTAVGFAVLGISGLAILAWFAWPVLHGLLYTPSEPLTAWLTALTAIWATLQAWGRAGSVLLRVLPGFVWVSLVMAAVGWSLMWVVSLMKFAKIPQGVAR